jgi:diaminohydroxyphosphoribosylaminopyrimidine deaminase/5-amino-6-(5-phosphoribosylamino)uracil reductase
MRWRRLFPSIAIGAGTVQADDPRLTARLPDGEWCPRRIILDGRLSSVPETGTLPRVYADAFREHTLVVNGPATSTTEVRRSRLVEAGVALRELPIDESGNFRIADLRVLLAAENLPGIYFEGGPMVARRLIEEKVLDYLFWYESPKRFPNPDALKAPPLSDFPLKDACRETFGGDVLTRGHLDFNGHGT